MPIMEEDKKSYVFAGKGGYLNLKKKKKKEKKKGKKKNLGRNWRRFGGLKACCHSIIDRIHCNALELGEMMR